jgi:Zn-dependent peptidase ImmA (M78 family)/transcriptional regulator with XRE-family HTH domain
MMALESVDPVKLGERLRIARSNAGLKQEQAAREVGLSRTTLVAIEQGQRRLRGDELRGLARVYRVPLNDLLRPEAVHVDLVPKFRKLGPEDEPGGPAAEAMRLLIKLATSAAEIEARMGQARVAAYPPERAILPGSLEDQAEELAVELRQRLGLGLAPLSDIVSLAEIELGVKIFFRPLHPSVSGAFVYDPAVGACILVNAHHPPERQIMTIVHELGHFMCARGSAEVYFGETDASREERLVTLFSIAFLIPAVALRRRFREFGGGQGSFTVRHLLVLAHAFGVSFEALTRRLESLQLIPQGTFDSLKHRGFAVEEAKRSTGLAPMPPFSKVPPRSTLLAIEAHRKGILSEGQLAEMLALDRLQLREFLDSLGGEEMNDEITVPT